MPAPKGNKNRLGIPHTEEVKRKISEKLKGIPCPTRGRPQSAEKRKRISEKLKGRIFSEEHRKKLSDAAIGKKKAQFSAEHIKKLSESAKNRRHTLEERKKMSESQKGEKGNNWQGGLTLKNKIARFSFEYKLWREAVFERDNFTCVWCARGNKNGERTPLQADHIKQFALYPELRFDLSNGRTLCLPCHKKTDTYARKL